MRVYAGVCNVCVCMQVYVVGGWPLNFGFWDFSLLRFRPSGLFYIPMPGPFLPKSMQWVGYRQDSGRLAYFKVHTKENELQLSHFYPLTL